VILSLGCEPTSDDNIATRFYAIIHDNSIGSGLDFFASLYFALLISRHTPLPLIFGKIRQVLMRSTHLGYTWVLSMSTAVLLLHDMLAFVRFFLDSTSWTFFHAGFGIPLGIWLGCCIRLAAHWRAGYTTMAALLFFGAVSPFVYSSGGMSYDDTLLPGNLPLTRSLLAGGLQRCRTAGQQRNSEAREAHNEIHAQKRRLV
jgi:hypothetical protein